MLGKVTTRSVFALVAMAVAGMLALPLTSRAAAAMTFAQVRVELRAWNLRPAPLFPQQLPSIFNGAKASLDRQGFDFNVDWTKDRPLSPSIEENYFAISFRRGDAALLGAVLYDPRDTHVQQVKIGGRSVFSIQANKAVLAWHAQGRTYLLIDKYVSAKTELRQLSPFVRSLRELG